MRALLGAILLGIVAAGAVYAGSADARAPITKNCPDGSVVKYRQKCPPAPEPTPSPTPTATATPTPSPTTPPVEGEHPPVVSGLNVAEHIIQIDPLPKMWSGPGQDVSAFRFWCAPGHVAYDDPIIMPGKPGQFHHLHQFFGNTAANANSNYESLRKTGDSTCINPLNRSGYWMSAMIGEDAEGRDVVIKPAGINIYYKRSPLDDPVWAANGWKPAGLARGLRMVFGFPGQSGRFKCVDASVANNVSDWTTMDGALAVCKTGQFLLATVETPSCWDGRRFDSEDHRSHVRYMFTNSWEGYLRCPADPDGTQYNHIIPTFTLQAAYEILPTDRPETWRPSSDEHMTPGQPRGTSFHADWWGAWEDVILEIWLKSCIDEHRSGASGNLCNGTMMKPTEWYNANLWKSERVPVPPRG